MSPTASDYPLPEKLKERLGRPGWRVVRVGLSEKRKHGTFLGVNGPDECCENEHIYPGGAAACIARRLTADWSFKTDADWLASAERGQRMRGEIE